MIDQGADAVSDYLQYVGLYQTNVNTFEFTAGKRIEYDPLLLLQSVKEKYNL